MRQNLQAGNPHGDSRDSRVGSRPTRFASALEELRRRQGKRGAIAPMSPEEMELLNIVGEGPRPLDRELQKLLRRGERIFPPGLDPETFKEREAEVRRVRGY
jgi:hypothetical protein